MHICAAIRTYEFFPIKVSTNYFQDFAIKKKTMTYLDAKISNLLFKIKFLIAFQSQIFLNFSLHLLRCTLLENRALLQKWDNSAAIVYTN